MFRSLLIVATVAAVSHCLSQLEFSYADRNPQLAWVRTIDGWEQSHVVEVPTPSSGPPRIHPALVASFMLGASLFSLIAFPHQRAQEFSMPTPRNSRRAKGTGLAVPA